MCGGVGVRSCVCTHAHVLTYDFNFLQFFSVADSLADETIFLRNKTKFKKTKQTKENPKPKDSEEICVSCDAR